MAEIPPRLADLVAAVPWLAAVPSDIAELLDRSEYVLPTGGIEAARCQLERSLAANVMTYRRHRVGPATGPHQLCRLLAPATLDIAGLGRIRRAEDRLRDVLFCAYARPLRFNEATRGVPGAGCVTAGRPGDGARPLEQAASPFLIFERG
jgi:hypothetical protein